MNDDGCASPVAKIDLCQEFEHKLECGMVFGFMEHARLVYIEYIRQEGFSVRRGDQRYIKKSTDIRWKEFVCHCAGAPNTTCSKTRVADYKKSIRRCFCLAKIRVHPVSPESWKILVFVKYHNHPLLSLDQTYLTRSAHFLSESRLGVVQAMNSVGIPLSMACGFMEAQCGGVQNISYIRKDAYDKIWRANKDKRVENGNSIALLNYLNKMTREDPFFNWKADYNEDMRLKHLFLRDSRSLTNYETFGDILLIDTTYKTNKYNLICAPFVGVNHHSTSVMFGVGFLSGETTECFQWFLLAFLESMHGKQPVVVFSNQCRALMNAIDSTFPAATRRLCQWHVNNMLDILV